MYSTVRRFSMFSFVLAVLHAIATVLLLFYFADMNFTTQFTWILYTATSAVGLLLLSWGLFDLSKDLEREYTSNAEYINKLSKRIKELEDRVY